MSQEHDNPESTTADEDSELNLQEASALLEAAKKRAQRQFDVWPPFLLLIGAFIFLVAYGAVWWSVRGQSPYVGPSGWALAVMYGSIVVWVVVVTSVGRRATSGISGPSVKRRDYRVGYFIIIIAYSVFQAALYHAGASHAIVYGIYPATMPWLFFGTVFVTIGALREDGRASALGGFLIALGIGASFAGPVVAWLVSGIGLCALLVGFAAVQVARRRA
jgi:hypothetical protein